jgi:DNA-binding SARP family transcriptional activator
VNVVSLRVNLFGEFRVWRSEDLVEREEWRRQKCRTLLKLLLTRPGYAFSRDEIIEALWPGVSPEAGDRSLRATVSLLRRVLEPDLERGSDSRYVLRRPPGYMFDRQPDCEVDTWEFEERQEKAEVARGAGSLEEAINEYRSALKLLRGEFLAEDPYEDWAMKAREEWHSRQLAVLSELSECLALRGRYTEAIEICGRALALDKYREDLHRRLMLYRYCAGEQALALQAYRRYAKTIKEELGAVPSPELARLKTQVEARDVPGVDTLRRYPKPRRPLRFPYSLSRMYFVGRDREYALLAERLKEMMEGLGGAVAVEGEAGVGKTRLVEEFLGYTRSRSVRALSGRCYERELGPPLEPVMDALGLPSTSDEAVSGLLQPRAEELGCLREAEPYDSTRIYHMLTRKLIHESTSDGCKGLVLFVDDVQWADQATLDFLSYLAKRISGERLLLVVSYRQEDVAEFVGWLEHLAERRAITTVGLSRLSLEDTTELLAHTSSRSFDELPSLAGFIYRESEGNPFYAVEYLRWLIESGAVLIDSRRRISALKGELLLESTLPSGVRSLLWARLSGMNDGTRGLLELAAVIGRSFDLGLLCKVSTHGQDTQTFGIMEPLMDSGLIVEAPEGTFYFSHDKLRQALYEHLNSPRRRVLHLRVAEALEGEGAEPAELAHHYLRAQAWHQALENLIHAGRRAEESYAWEIALESYARALEIVGKLPNSDQRRFELLAARESLLERMDRWVERAATVQEMLELANRLGDRAQLAEVHIRRIGVLAALADPAGGAAAGQAALTIFRELGDKAGEARAYREMAYVCWMHQDYAGSLKANFRALRIHRETDNRRGEAGDLGNIAQVYRSMGDHDQAVRWAEEAARACRKAGDRVGEQFGSFLASIHRERGDPKAALPLVLEGLQFDLELGDKHLASLSNAACGALYLDLQAPDKALEHFRAAASLNREIGHVRDEGHALMSVGISLEQVGDHVGAADAYRRAIELLGMAYEVSGLAEELSGKADALTLLADALRHSLAEPMEALGAYEAAAEIYRELGDAYRLRKALLGLAGLRWRTGSLEGSTRGYEEALNLARDQDEPVHEAAALASLSVVYRDLGRLRESIRYGREALGLLRELDDLQAEAYVLTSLAESYRRLEHYPSALSRLRRSLRLRQRIGDKEGEARALFDLARIYESLGQKGRALACSEEAALKTQATEATYASIAKRRN